MNDYRASLRVIKRRFHHKDSIVCAVTSNIRYPRRDDTRGCQLGANVGRVHLL
jgi:hypothetical protein